VSTLGGHRESALARSSRKGRRREPTPPWNLVDDEVVVECLQGAGVNLDRFATRGLRTGINAAITQANRLRGGNAFSAG
jgi:hypothetical protein